MTPIFSTHLIRLALHLLPLPLRRLPGYYPLLLCAAGYLQRLVEQLRSFAAATEQALGYTSQACSLQRMLNDYCDPIDRRITVADTQDATFTTIWQVSQQGQTQWLMLSESGSGNPQLIPTTDAVQYGDGFTVGVPNEIYASDAQRGMVEAYTDRYRLAGTSYAVITN